MLGVFEYRKLLFTFMRSELITPHLPFKDAKIPRKAWRGPVESRLRLFRMIFRRLRSKTTNNMSKDVETPCTCDNLLGLYTRSYNYDLSLNNEKFFGGPIGVTNTAVRFCTNSSTLQVKLDSSFSSSKH